jgi:hypothetical protein
MATSYPSGRPDRDSNDKEEPARGPADTPSPDNPVNPGPGDYGPPRGIGGSEED